ncbi:hypothetical protein CPB85DRAFT_1483376 [Mucidula mucida]|nr:hypothetical protein CPB85DRAFT_1483376 [Mucidula mucida]
MNTQPPKHFDSLIHNYIHSSGIDPNHIPSTRWTDRALHTYGANPANQISQPRPKKTGRHFKPVARKYRPVPSYMPDPAAQVFKDIPKRPPNPIPLDPPPIDSLDFSGRITRERLDLLVSKIPPDTLTPKEMRAMAYVVMLHPNAFAFDYSEKGEFSPEYYPDYEIPVIEHTPWQRPPIFIPIALRDHVRDEIQRLEQAGKFEPSVASYRSVIFPVAKKPGSSPPVRLVINVEELNAVTV